MNLLADPTPFNFLRDAASARSAALAGCFVQMTGDPNAVFYNPATIATVTDKRFSTTFLKHVLDINSGSVSYIHPHKIDWASEGIFAGSVSYTNYGSFIGADKYGVKTSDFGANDIILAGTYANVLDENLYYGATLKFIFMNIQKANTTAMAVDAGLIYMMPEKQTNIGISILHAGTQITKFNGYSESLPLDIRMGINHRLKGLPLLANFSFNHLADKTNNFFDKFSNFSLAGELYLGEYLQARIGYDNYIRRKTTPTSDRKLSGFSAGVGIKTTSFNLDYGAAQIGTAAMLHRISLSLEL